MTLLERTGLAALVCGAAVLGVVACQNKESLGSDNHDGGTGAANGTGGRDGDGGESSTGGANVAGASGGEASSGGTAGKGGGGGTAGRAAGGTAGRAAGGTAGKGAGGAAGTAGTAGGGGDCSTVACAPLPPQCPAGTLIAKPAGNCCVQCVPKGGLPLAACIVNGDRYENGETIQWSACSSCVCVDGVIGRCTGACLPGTDAGPDHHPQCADDEGLIAGCNTCNYEHCEAYEYKCRTLGCNDDAGSFCGAEYACVQGACVSLGELCLI